MTLTVITEAPCLLCGHRERGLFIYNARVNKNSLVLNRGFGSMPPQCCRECRSPVSNEAIGRLDAESAAKVRAYRTSKGWAV